MESVPLTPRRWRRSDAVMVVTDHAAVDYARRSRVPRLIVDTRGASYPRRASERGEGSEPDGRQPISGGRTRSW